MLRPGVVRLFSLRLHGMQAVWFEVWVGDNPFPVNKRLLHIGERFDGCEFRAVGYR